jgi:hypothetical protein
MFGGKQLLRSGYYHSVVTTEIHIENLEERLKFEVKLQVALRSTAMRTSKFYEHQEKFKNYIKEREDKLKNLLNIEGEFTIMEDDKVIYP